MKRNKALVVGLTGPAGCGKSHICGVLAKLTKTLVIDTDTLCRKQVAKGGISYDGIVKEFGPEILLEDGELNRPALAKVVFNSPEKLAKLNSLTHPNVIKASKELIRENSKTYSLIIVESAILTRSNCNSFCDEVWYVYTPRAERAKRLAATRGYSAERIKGVMKSQDTDKFFREHADSVIENRDGVPEEELERKLKSLLGKKSIECL